MSLEEAIEGALRWEVDARRMPSISYALIDRERVVASAHIARRGAVAPTEASLFRIGSLTKMMTAAAAMKLVGAGKLDLDLDIGDVLPVARGASLRQLMSHTSGLTREAGLGHYLDGTAAPLDATVRSLAGLPRKVAAGTYRYSNAGFALVGAAVEATSNRAYADCLRDQILLPLGMGNTGVGFDDASRAGLAPAQTWTFDGDTPAPLFNLGSAPAGNVVSTLRDMARFAQALLRGELLARTTLEAMWAVPGERGYGLGFAVDRLDGRRTVGHGGVVYGYASLLTALPDDGLAVVLFSTMDMTNQVLSRLGAYILRAALAERGLGRAPQPPVRTAAVIGRNFAGTYSLGGGAAHVELRQDGDGLYLLERGVPFEVRANGHRLVIDGRIQGQGSDGALLPIEIVPDALRWRGERWVQGPPPLSSPPAAVAGHLGTYGPDFMPTHLTFSSGRLNCLIEALCAHTCEPIGGNRYLMHGPLYEDEVLEVGVFNDGRAALRVGEMLLERLSQTKMARTGPASDRRRPIRRKTGF